MKQITHRISGKVVDRRTSFGNAGLRVEAWDKDLLFNDLVGNVGNKGARLEYFCVTRNANVLAEIYRYAN